MTIVGAIAVPHPPLIVPAVGRGDERRIQATIDAYERATAWLLAQEPDCLVITSPHAPMFRDAFHVTTDAALDALKECGLDKAAMASLMHNLADKLNHRVAGRLQVEAIVFSNVHGVLGETPGAMALSQLWQ